MQRILFVCLGNICRSPMAEAIFNSKIREKGLIDIFQSDSCGTANYHIGLAPDPRAIKNLLENGVPVSHAARQLTVADLEYFDLVLAMDQRNYETIIGLPKAIEYQHKIKLMRDYDPHEKGEVPDPYYGGDEDFQKVFEILDRTIEKLITAIAQEPA